MTDHKSATTAVFSLIKQPSGVALLLIDDKSASINTLKASFADEMTQCLEQIRIDKSIKALVIASGKEDSFIAGADIHMLDQLTNKEEIIALSRQGQMIFDKLARLTIPTVAAINGTCLGGGLELVLACRQRICSDNAKTLLGLPEVQLGLLPGSGGTQRLPKLIGLQKALDIMLTGKSLRPKQALRCGLVCDVVPFSVLLPVAEKLALQLALTPRRDICANKIPLLDRLLAATSLGRRLIYRIANKNVLTKSQGNYPAPIKIIACVKAGYELSAVQGFQQEAEYFAELVLSSQSKALRQLFFATTQMKKEFMTTEQHTAIEHVGIVGGGFMGGGIAYVTATKNNLPVRIKDLAQQGISKTFQLAYQLLNSQVKRGFITPKAMQKKLSNISGTTDYSGFKQCDLVIEAVFEDLATKQQVLSDIESYCSDNTIFASNTSSLPISAIAEKAQRPENVIGLHYFSPVDKMPLVEVIVHAGTSAQTLNSVINFARQQGKTPIVVQDQAGFYVNRILSVYMNEATRLLLGGEQIEDIDNALVKFGFPLGPLQLLDEVGIDVATKIGPILQQALGARFQASSVFELMLQDQRFGKKNKKGFYLYNTDQKKSKQVDRSVYRLFSITPEQKLSPDELVTRTVYLMLNEAVSCLANGIIRNPRDGDIGAIFGIGFPPFLGGPFWLIDQLGVHHVVQQLNAYKANYGERYQACDLMIEMAEKGTTFY